MPLRPSSYLRNILHRAFKTHRKDTLMIKVTNTLTRDQAVTGDKEMSGGRSIICNAIETCYNVCIGDFNSQALPHSFSIPVALLFSSPPALFVVRGIPRFANRALGSRWRLVGGAMAWYKRESGCTLGRHLSAS